MLDQRTCFGYRDTARTLEVPIVLNPGLHGFLKFTQSLISRDSHSLIKWSNRFMIAKRLVEKTCPTQLYGSNNIVWENHAHPANLSRMISWMPRINEISLAYCLEFVFPECSMGSVNLTELSQTMALSSNRSEPLANLMNSPVTAKNEEDFKRILTAMTMPMQAVIETESTALLP